MVKQQLGSSGKKMTGPLVYFDVSIIIKNQLRQSYAWPGCVKATQRSACNQHFYLYEMEVA